MAPRSSYQRSHRKSHWLRRRMFLHNSRLDTAVWHMNFRTFFGFRTSGRSWTRISALWYAPSPQHCLSWITFSVFSMFKYFDLDWTDISAFGPMHNRTTLYSQISIGVSFWDITFVGQNAHPVDWRPNKRTQGPVGRYWRVAGISTNFTTSIDIGWMDYWYNVEGLPKWMM